MLSSDWLSPKVYDFLCQSWLEGEVCICLIPRQPECLVYSRCSNTRWTEAIFLENSIQWLPITFRLKCILLPEVACKVLAAVPLSGCSVSSCLAIQNSLHNIPVLLNFWEVAECFILWPLDAKSWLIRKKKKKNPNPDAVKDWGQEEKGTPDNEMVGWHHWLDGHEFEQALGVGDGQGSLACCSPWGCRVRHDWATEQRWQMLHELSFLPLYLFLLFLEHSPPVVAWILPNPSSFPCLSWMSDLHLSLSKGLFCCLWLQPLSLSQTFSPANPLSS